MIVATLLLALLVRALLQIGGLAALIVSVLVETPVDPLPESQGHPEAEKVYQR